MLLSLTTVIAARAQSGPAFALGFDGVNDDVSVAHHTALNAFPLTVTTWIRTTQTTGAPGLINKIRFAGILGLNGWQVYLTDGNVRARYIAGLEDYVGEGADGLGLNGGPVADGVWHHIAFAVDADGGRLYVDGEPRSSLPWEGNPAATTPTSVLYLG